MASKQELKEANYVHRGDNGKYIEELGQCNFSPCDHSKIIKDDVTNEEYRYCIKLQMPVDDYDSCKYHSEERWISLMGQMANLFKEEDEARARKSQKQLEMKKKSHWMPILLIIFIVILIYVWIKLG